MNFFFLLMLDAFMMEQNRLGLVVAKEVDPTLAEALGIRWSLQVAKEANILEATIFSDA